jgi:hypothetical protein
MPAPTQINHRRDRHEIRRILAQLVVRGRDLTGSYFPEGFDLSDRLDHMPINDNRDDFVVAEKGGN